MDNKYSFLNDEIVTDETGAVYAVIENGRMLVKTPNVKRFRIPEGVEKIDRLAFHHCVFEDLHIPSTCKMEDWPVEEWPVWGNERIQGCLWT